MRILIELLKNVDQERSKVYMESKQNLSQFDVMIEIIIGALTHLAKDSLCKSIVKEMDPISVIIRVRSRGKAERSNFHCREFLVFVFTIQFITTNIQ